MSSVFLLIQIFTFVYCTFAHITPDRPAQGFWLFDGKVAKLVVFWRIREAVSRCRFCCKTQTLGYPIEKIVDA